MSFLGNLFRGKPPAKGKGKGKTKPRASGSGRPRSSAQPEQMPLPEPGMSLDRKLDIVGIIMIVIGLLSLFSLFSADQSPLLAAWLNMLSQIAGWGRFGLPIGLIVVGGWIVLRKFGDKLPRVEFERLTGIILLYLALLVSLHFYAAPTTEQIWPMARAGEGGGFVGALFLSALFAALGALGTFVVLVAWWLLAVVFTLGLSVPELVALFSSVLRNLRGQPPTQPLPPINRRPTENAQPRPVAPPVAASAEARRPAAPANNASKLAPTAPPIVPPAANTPNPAYDQPLVIGGEQVWELPQMEEILENGTESGADDGFDRKRVQIIEQTLASFGAPVKVVEINRGPTITQFGVEPDFVETRGGKRTKVKVGKITALADDLALALSAKSIRIEAPVPGKGYVGIEVPNESAALVALRDVMESEQFDNLHGSLRLALGQDVSGSAIVADLASMPHMLIAGTTGSGKSVCVNGIIAALLLQNTPDDLKILMVDPKRVELTGYNGIPHLAMPVVVELERVVASLQWVMREMDERYRKFAKIGGRNITDYNERAKANGEKKLPYLIVIIDELADLMMMAPDETERIITRLAQLARATGIHMILATQRPSVDVVTGLIKANFKSRVAFAVASGTDSRVILDQPGAERLLGRGDMLFQPPDAPAPIRSQGIYVSDTELQRLTRYWKGARGFEAHTTNVGDTAVTPPVGTPVNTDNFVAVGPGVRPTLGPMSTPPITGVRQGVSNLTPSAIEQKQLWDPAQFGEPLGKPDGEDELLAEAIKAVREMKKASISLLQRRLRIGYTRAARLIDVLEEKGIIGPAKPGAQQREVIGADEDYNPNTPTSGGDENTRSWTADET
ncbi:MAG: DNA translocase FtsK 4TM domain-containing protein [Anaerolineales bacterium]|nr:DNA translocase FtsK 4TM domain-containing protein [Anaerolineales bacterium]